MKLKLAYFGTPSFSARFLEKLLQDKSLPIDPDSIGVEVALVVTQPDRPVGRKQILEKSPVKIVAEKYNVKTFEGEDVRLQARLGVPTGEAAEKRGIEPLIKSLSNIDLCLVFAYGKILPESILALPKYGFWNIHPSLLPKYRGASPTTYPLILGDKITGVTLMKMDAQMDHGPIINAQAYDIPKDMIRPELEEKLSDLGFELFKKNLLNVIASSSSVILNTSEGSQWDSSVASLTQNDKKATYTRLLTKQDGFVPLTLLKKAIVGEEINHEELPEIIKEYLNKYPIFNFQFSIFNLWRGLARWPGLWTIVTINGKELRLKLLDLSLDIHTSLYILHINSVQLEGKNEVSFEQLNSMYNIF